MPLLDGALTKSNPLVRGVFVVNSDEGQDFPPPGTSFRITDDLNIRITDAGDNRITDS